MLNFAKIFKDTNQCISNKSYYKWRKSEKSLSLMVRAFIIVF